MRLVVNLRPLNPHCVQHTCRYESLSLLSRIAVGNDWCFAVEKKDGYHHLAVRPEHVKYFAFELDGEYFSCPVLPFGWCNSPYHFVKFMRPFVQHMRSPHSQLITQQSDEQQPALANPTPGMGVLPWLDDFLMTQHSHKAAVASSAFCRSEMQALGLQPHDKKTDWAPKQRREHLGFEIDFVDGVFRIPAAKGVRVRAIAKDCICRAKRSARWVSCATIQQFCGLAVSLQLAVPPARFYLQELYSCLAFESTWPGHVKLTKQAIRDLGWWASMPAKWTSRQIFQSPASHTLHTDASGSIGWGAVLDGSVVARGYWREHQRQGNICCKELLAVRLGIESFLTKCAGCTIRLGEDNTAALAAVKNLSAKSPALMAELRRLWYILDTHRIHLDAFYVKSAENPADAPSRFEDRDDYRLTGKWVAYFQALYGPHSVDRFATANNTICQRYNTLFFDPGTEAVDAFAQDWTGDNNWVKPPLLRRQLTEGGTETAAGGGSGNGDRFLLASTGLVPGALAACSRGGASSGTVGTVCPRQVGLPHPGSTTQVGCGGVQGAGASSEPSRYRLTLDSQARAAPWSEALTPALLASNAVHTQEIASVAALLAHALAPGT